MLLEKVELPDLKTRTMRWMESAMNNADHDMLRGVWSYGGVFCIRSARYRDP